MAHLEAICPLLQDVTRGQDLLRVHAVVGDDLLGPFGQQERLPIAARPIVVDHAVAGDAIEEPSRFHMRRPTHFFPGAAASALAGEETMN